MKKKILGVGIVVMLVVMLFILTGCGNNEDGKKENNKKTSKNSLVSVVKVGDYVDYKVKVGETYTATSDKTGIDKEQIFETNGKEIWRVLSIEDDGTINLVSENGIATKFEKEFILGGEKGYVNGIEELNNISKIYANGEHAVSGRSMNLSDLVNLIGIDRIAKIYENKNEVDLSNYTGEEKLEKVYKLMNEEYGNTYTVNGQTKKVNSAFNLSSAEDGFGIDDIVEDENIIDLLNVNIEYGTVWLADQIVDIKEYNGVQNPEEPLCFKCGLATYGMSEYKQYQGYVGRKYGSSISHPDLYYILRNDVNDIYHVYGDKDIENYIRPVISLEKNVKCGTGNGTKENPYTLK